MKKLLLFVVIVVCSASARGQMKYGIKGGLNLSDVVITNYINPDAESEFDIKAGLHAGVFTIFEVNDRFSFDVELLYSNKGVNAGNRINLHYINLPLLTQYRLSEKFIVELGPELGYLFAAKSTYGDVSNIWNNKLDIGLDAGIQMKLSEKLGAGLRYNAGFSSVVGHINPRDTNNIPTEETIKYQNRVLQLSFSYLLGEM